MKPSSAIPRNKNMNERNGSMIMVLSCIINTGCSARVLK